MNTTLYNVLVVLEDGSYRTYREVYDHGKSEDESVLCLVTLNGTVVIPMDDVSTLVVRPRLFEDKILPLSERTLYEVPGSDSIH
jgi:hypothetical protein